MPEILAFGTAVAGETARTRTIAHDGGQLGPPTDSNRIRRAILS
jgi:hypothetical protein